MYKYIYYNIQIAYNIVYEIKLYYLQLIIIDNKAIRFPSEM